MPDIHSLIILLSFLSILIWGCCLKRGNPQPVEPFDKRLAIDRLLEALTRHNELLDELVERLVRIETYLLETEAP
jgi:hypothetical protein